MKSSLPANLQKTTSLIQRAIAWSQPKPQSRPLQSSFARWKEVQVIEQLELLELEPVCQTKTDRFVPGFNQGFCEHCGFPHPTDEPCLPGDRDHWQQVIREHPDWTCAPFDPSLETSVILKGWAK
jgi:hypothetical protein